MAIQEKKVHSFMDVAQQKMLFQQTLMGHKMTMGWRDQNSFPFWCRNWTKTSSTITVRLTCQKTSKALLEFRCSNNFTSITFIRWNQVFAVLRMVVTTTMRRILWTWESPYCKGSVCIFMTKIAAPGKPQCAKVYKSMDRQRLDMRKIVLFKSSWISWTKQSKS